MAHVKNIISKGVGIMLRARNYVTKNWLKTLYYSYIYPYLIYCIEIWGISAQTHLRPLLLPQKKIVRIITYSTFYTYTDPIFKALQILTVGKLVIHIESLLYLHLIMASIQQY